MTIVVSRGPRPITLDDYSGQVFAGANAALTGLGLRVAETQQYSTSVDRGLVIGTEPPAGTVVHRGDTITIIVSLGPKTFPMPNVLGETKDRAVAELQALGLVVRTIQLPNSTNDIVAGQIPGPGTTVSQGQTVTLYIGG